MDEVAGLRANVVEQKLATPRLDASLCHGIAGLSEIVLIAAETLGDDRYRAATSRAAQELIERYDANGDWPSGAPETGPNPTLMLGNAGIGLHFLRAHKPAATPPILQIVP